MPVKDQRGALVPTSELEQRRLELEANEILQGWATEMNRTPGTGGPEMVDFLTEWKQRSRWKREVPVSDTVSTFNVLHGPGAPDRAVRHGYRHRVLNIQQTWLNSREPIHSQGCRPRGTAAANSTPSTKWLLYNHPAWRFDDGKDWPVTIRWKE